jgi:hypothetical protein
MLLLLPQKKQLGLTYQLAKMQQLLVKVAGGMVQQVAAGACVLVTARTAQGCLRVQSSSSTVRQ